ncbi:MAG: PilC/PilY family type IV pilus protein, partial [Nitrospinota bacterium]|nr:PilC/PilY family type IV pilus protein [Nitrospinota bacterium]
MASALLLTALLAGAGLTGQASAGAGGGAGGGGTAGAPNPFTFTNLVDQAVSALVPEGGTTLTGQNAAKTSTISIAGPGCQYSTNAGVSWSSAAGTIQGNGSFDIRTTTSASFSTTVTCTVTVEGVVGSWTVTTAAAPPAPPGGGGAGPVPPAPPGLPAGCVAGGDYVSDTGGFAAADYGFSNASVNAGGQVTLDLTTNPLARTLKVPYDQEVYVAYVDATKSYRQYYHEDYWKSTTGAGTYDDPHMSYEWYTYLGWFIKPLVESYWPTATGAPFAAPVTFTDLYNVDQTYLIDPVSGGRRLINYALPNIYDYDRDGLMDAPYDPTLPQEWLWASSWPADSFLDFYLVWFGSNTWAWPPTEADLKANHFSVTGDGVADGRDMRVRLGRFKAGTEIALFTSPANYGYEPITWNSALYGTANTVFTPYDTTNSSYWNHDWADLVAQPIPDGNNPACSNSGAGVAGKTKYDLLHYTTLLEGAYKVNRLYLSFDLGKVAPESTADDVAGVPTYIDGPDCADVSFTYKGGGGTSYPFSWTQGLFTTETRNALKDRFGLTFSGTLVAGAFENKWSVAEFDYLAAGNKLDYPHFLFVAPDKDPFTTVVAVESNMGVVIPRAEIVDTLLGVVTEWHDASYYTDLDFNDQIYLLETRKGGTVQMSLAASPSSSLTAAQFVTSGTIKVTDYMPAASCSATAGDSNINYYMSSDGGNEWVHIDEWDVVRKTNSSGVKIDNWTPGSTEATYREATVSFLNLGLIGNRLLWKADMITSNKNCLPAISKVEMAYNASGARSFAHTSPVTLANVMYDGAFDWSNTWVDQVFRGHLYSKRIYDPTNWTGGFNTVDLWDAGSRMGGSASVNSGVVPTSRNIKTANMTVTQVTDEAATLTSGAINGTNMDFSGKVSKQGILAGSVTITTVDSTGRRETFTDSGMRLLTGSLAGYGKVNRDAGTFTIRTTKPLGSGTKIKVSYSYYKINSTVPVAFNTTNINAGMLGLNNNWYWTNNGAKYDYDLNGDGAYNSTTDANWLTNWVQGYRTPIATKKEWFMGAVDHSSPAVVGAPGLQGWYYGSDVTDDERESFDMFRCNQRKRDTQLYVGSRSGMLHAVYAGKFRPYFVDETLLVAPFTCNDFTGADKTNLYKFRGDLASASNTGAINPNGPIYHPLGSPATTVDIHRGYYEWTSDGGANDNKPNYGTGNEVWSIIPPNMVNRLKNAPMKAEDKAFMDASPAAAHIRFADGTWHTMIIVAQGNGGDSVMAVDVTNPSNPLIVWQYSDPDMYRSRSAPSVGSVGRVVAGGNSNWVVMFVSGVNTDPNTYPAVYLLELETGKLLYRLELDTDPEALGSTPSGQPAMIDSDGNGYVDRFFIGTDKGILFKGVMPDNPTAATGTNFGICTFFKTDIGATSGERLAVYASPSVTSSNTVSATGALEFKVNVF